MSEEPGSEQPKPPVRGRQQSAPPRGLEVEGKSSRGGHKRTTKKFTFGKGGCRLPKKQVSKANSGLRPPFTLTSPLFLFLTLGCARSYPSAPRASTWRLVQPLTELSPKGVVDASHRVGWACALLGPKYM